MFAKLSIKRDIDRNNVDKVASVIRDVVKVLSVPGLAANQLNSDVVNVGTSSVIDNQSPGWTFATSTKDGSSLGSGSGFAIGDSWTLTKGSKQIVISLSDSSADGFGQFGIAVQSSEHPDPVGLFPGNDIIVLTGVGNNVTFGAKAGVAYNV